MLVTVRTGFFTREKQINRASLFQLNKLAIAYEMNSVRLKCGVNLGVLHDEIFAVSALPSAGYIFHFLGVERRVDIGFVYAVRNVYEIFDKVVFELLVALAVRDIFGEYKIIGHRNIIYAAEKSRKTAGCLEQPLRSPLRTLRSKGL